MKNLWLIRHAESEQNLTGSSKKNSKLSSRGKVQAAELRGPCELLILSPLRRSLETYSYSQLEVGRLITSEFVREVIDSPGCEFDLETRDRYETKEEVSKRVTETVKLLREQKETNITLLSHACFLRSLFVDQLKLSFEGYLANVQVVRFLGVEL